LIVIVLAVQCIEGNCEWAAVVTASHVYLRWVRWHFVLLQSADKWDELLERILRLLLCHTYAWILLQGK